MPALTRVSHVEKIKDRFLAFPWWVQVFLLYGFARFVTLCIMLGTARFQGANPWTMAHPDYLHYVQLWDSKWYENIYDSSYPSVLPKDSIGTVQQNNWAFYPVFPFTVRLLHLVTGLDWLHLSPFVATASGFVAALMAYKLFALKTTPVNSLWAVAFIASFPTAPILQVPYAEALHMAFLACALYFLVKRNYLVLLLVVPLMCLTRPAGVPFAALMFFHTVHRWHVGHFAKKQEEFSTFDKIMTALMTLYCCAWALAWPAIASLVTHVPSAYTDTELAWRGGTLTFFVPWFNMGAAVLGPLGFFAPFIVFPAIFCVLYSRPFDALGFDMRTWCTCYILYLFAVLEPQTSTFRMLLPLFPMALGAVMISKDKSYRSLVIIMFVLLQIVWVAWLWDFTPLPQGGDWPP